MSAETQGPTRRLTVALMGVVLIGLVTVSVLGRGASDSWSTQGGAVGEPVRTAPDPEQSVRIAGRTVDRLQLFRTGNAGDSLSLSGEEVTAVLLHVLPGMLPQGVVEPRVSFAESKVTVDVRVASAAYPGAMSLGALLEVFPDTLEVRLHGTLSRHAGALVFGVTDAEAEGVPLPGSLVGALIGSTPLATSTGGAVIAELRVGWPSGFRTIEVVGDRLELRAAEPIVERAVDGSDGA